MTTLEVQTAGIPDIDAPYAEQYEHARRIVAEGGIAKIYVGHPDSQASYVAHALNYDGVSVLYRQDKVVEAIASGEDGVLGVVQAKRRRGSQLIEGDPETPAISELLGQYSGEVTVKGVLLAQRLNNPTEIALIARAG